ncbi:MAG: DUF4391 domain-containing protein [Candidatus Gastranaerophilales bacterium]|nr:DUF4391 domain-containing protein [Candidatus Gastranaerophilales bacterium]
MLFSEKTQLNRIMPKAKFMKLAELSTPVRAEIQNNVERLILANILRQETTNISTGKVVKEIDVFEFLLKEKQVSDNLIKEIDSSIPKHILFVFKYKNLAQIAVTFKEKLATGEKFKVIKVYRTEWRKADEFDFELNGLDLDSVFNGFIAQIAGGKVEIDETKDIKQAVQVSIDKEKLERRIEQLKNKIRKEPQFNKQLELRKELKELESKRG